MRGPGKQGSGKQGSGKQGSGKQGSGKQGPGKQGQSKVLGQRPPRGWSWGGRAFPWPPPPWPLPSLRLPQTCFSNLTYGDEGDLGEFAQETQKRRLNRLFALQVRDFLLVFFFLSTHTRVATYQQAQICMKQEFIGGLIVTGTYMESFFIFLDNVRLAFLCFLSPEMAPVFAALTSVLNCVSVFFRFRLLRALL